MKVLAMAVCAMAAVTLDAAQSQFRRDVTKFATLFFQGAGANPEQAADQYAHIWRCEGLNAWKSAHMSRNVRVEDGSLKLGSTG